MTTQQQSTAQINQLIQQSTDALTCGPDCQKIRKTDQLRQGYLDAKANVETAPFKLQQAEQSYYTYAEGTAGYNKIRAAQATQQAATITSSAASTFQHGVATATDLTAEYDSLYTTYQNMYDLYEKYLEENAEMQMEVNTLNTDKITNNRKSFYESQGYDVLNSWYKLFKWIYIFLIVIYILGMFLSNSSYSFVARICILVALILYPLVINYIVIFVYSIMLRIYSLMPKNAYTTINNPN